MSYRLLRTTVPVVVASLLSACALIPDKVAIDYVPDGPVTPVAGAKAVLLTVNASDRRTQHADRISTKRNFAGMEMARIDSDNDVVDLVRRNVESGLRAQGFAIGPGRLVVSVELQTFYNDFHRGLGAWTETGEVAFTLKVTNAGGTVLYSSSYDGTATDSFFLSTAGNAKASLQKALTLAIRKMLEDQALQQALLSAARSSALLRPGRQTPTPISSTAIATSAFRLRFPA
jgi:uncharacterized lipoprotein YajG